MTDINIGAISEALNNKVDLNQLNTNTQGLSYGSGWGMPSSRYIDLTLGASGSFYTAPANGYFYFWRTTNSNNQYVVVENFTTNLSLHGWVPVTSGGAVAFIPARKGEVAKISYTAGGTVLYFRFYYAEGEPS